MALLGFTHGDPEYSTDLERLLEDQAQPPIKTPPVVDRMKRSSGDPFWSRQESRIWMVTLLVGTCLLYCARASMPICAVSMSEQFGWNKQQSGIVLSSFFWGYCLTQVFGGHLSDKVGGEKVILLSALLWGLITAVIPLVTLMTTAPLVHISMLRFLKGLFQGVHFPALASLFSQRVRESERAFTCSVVGCGSQFGTLLMGGVGSLLLERYSWESVFYFAGSLTVIWGYCLSTYLLRKSESMLTFYDLEKCFSLLPQSHVTRKSLFRKMPVWAVIVAQMSVASTAFTLFSWLPTFFKEKFPDGKGWVFNVIPWLFAIPVAVFSGFLSDCLISQGYKTIWVRKLMQVMGMGISSFFVLCLGHTDNYYRAIFYASVAVGLQTFNHSGITVNVQDLAPSCSGMLFGVANTGGAMLVFCSPWSVSARCHLLCHLQRPGHDSKLVWLVVIKHNGVLLVYLSGYLIEALNSWAPMFHLVVTVNILGLMFFLEFAKSDRVDIDVGHSKTEEK